MLCVIYTGNPLKRKDAYVKMERKRCDVCTENNTECHSGKGGLIPMIRQPDRAAGGSTG